MSRGELKRTDTGGKESKLKPVRGAQLALATAKQCGTSGSPCPWGHLSDQKARLGISETREKMQRAIAEHLFGTGESSQAGGVSTEGGLRKLASHLQVILARPLAECVLRC